MACALRVLTCLVAAHESLGRRVLVAPGVSLFARAPQTQWLAGPAAQRATTGSPLGSAGLPAGGQRSPGPPSNRAAGRLGLAAQSRKQSEGVVVDDSDFGDDDTKVDKKKADLNRILEAADSLAIKKVPKRKSKKMMSLESELSGLSLDEDPDQVSDLYTLSKRAARTQGSDVSLETRVVKWASELKDTISNPTPIQITYVSIFFGSVACIFFAFIIASSLGSVRYRGMGRDLAYERRMNQDPSMAYWDRLMANREKFMTVRDIKSLSSADDTKPDGVSKGQWGLPNSIPATDERFDGLNQTFRRALTPGVASKTRPSATDRAPVVPDDSFKTPPLPAGYGPATVKPEAPAQ